MTNNEARKAIIQGKYSIRELSKTCQKMQGLISDTKAEISTLKKLRFNHEKVNKKELYLSEYEKTFSHLLQLKKDAYLSTNKAMIYYDMHYNSNHEKAQLLSISHTRYEHFLKQDHLQGVERKDSLLMAANLHAECYGENETFIGESGNRDHPLFSATSYAMVKAMSEDAELKEKMNEVFEDAFGTLPRYNITTNANGKQEINRVPPSLKLIH